MNDQVCICPECPSVMWSVLAASLALSGLICWYFRGLLSKLIKRWRAKSPSMQTWVLIGEGVATAVIGASVGYAAADTAQVEPLFSMIFGLGGAAIGNKIARKSDSVIDMSIRAATGQTPVAKLDNTDLNALLEIAGKGKKTDEDHEP